MVKGERKVLDRYTVKFGGYSIPVEIVESRKEYVPLYEVGLIEVGTATKVILDEIKREVLTTLDIPPEIFVRVERIHELSSLVRDRIKSRVLEMQLVKSEEDAEKLAEYITLTTLGLGAIEILLHDDNLEEIVVNSSKEPVWVYHKKYGWLKTNIYIDSEETIMELSQSIARKVGRQIDNLHPLLDAHLPTGDRVNATLFPISSFGNTITIRKFRRKPFTIVDLLEFNTITEECLAFIWQAIQYEMNILVAGGTGSGKTTMLNCILCFIPPNHRIISIEDTRELRLPKFLHWVPLTTRAPNPEGKGAVTMLDLLVNSLRMRPDRIVVGEVRRKEEAEVMFEAMRTGHSVYATFHADNAAQTVTRLTSPPISMPPEVLEALHLIVVQFRHRRLGIRRTLQIAEIIPGGKERGVNLNIIYRWRASTDKITRSAESVRVIGELMEYAQMTRSEIEEDINEKAEILRWMRKYKVKNIDAIGKIIAEYYRNKDELLELVRKDEHPKVILEDIPLE